MSPRATDSDANHSADGRIILTMRDECPDCATEVEVFYLTDARDEDGLADLEAGSVTAEVDCPDEDCGTGWVSTYDGWTMFGEAG